MSDLAADLRLRSAPPAVPAGFVARPRLADRLAEGVTRPVTLLSAGPGYGKTLTLAAWVRSGAAPLPTAWLSLERSDDRLPTFWSAVLGALRHLDAVPADSTLRQLVPAARFGLREVERIRSGLADLAHPVALVLDDFQHITGSRLLESVAMLIEHQPPQLRLIISTRYDPALRLRRLRLSGDVTEIRAADLQFDEAEAGALLRGHGLTPSPDDLHALVQHTQGWPAGLRLAAMSLDPDAVGDGIARFSGSVEPVAEYLMEEVMSQLPVPDREFLLRISVVEQLDASLAAVLSGRDDSQTMLERLAARNAFVVGLAGGATWFRCHPLFRELLRHQLWLAHPALVPELHERAARWFVDRDDPIGAIRQLTLAENWDGVGRVLIEHAAPEVLTPNGPALVAALEPAAARSATRPEPGTLLAAAVCSFHRADFADMLRDASDAAAMLAESGPADDAGAEVLTAMLRVAHSRVANPAWVADDAGLVLKLVDRIPRRRLPAVRRYRAVALTNLGAGQLWRGELDDAQASLLAAESACRDEGLGLPELTVWGHLSVLDAMCGRLMEAGDRASRAEQLAQRRGWTAEPQAAAHCVAEAMIALDRDELDIAQDRVDFASSAAGPGSDAACRVALAVLATVIAATRGDAEAAQRAAGRLTAMGQQFDLPPLLARWSEVAEAQAALCAGDAEQALATLPAAPVAVGFPDALRRVARARCRLALDQPAAALEELGGSTTFLRHRATVVEARVLVALASYRLHRETAALSAISQAVDLAAPAGIVRPFRTGDAEIVDLLRRHRTLIGRHSGFVAGIIETRGAGRRVAPPAVPASEPLSTRELVVLQYLPTMLKSADIAAELFVSVNTVKSHQQSIYRKLGVTTRRGAVDRARELALV